MLTEIVLTPEWELQPPHIIRFARQVSENFAGIQDFIGSVRSELSYMRVSQDKLTLLEQNAQVALNTALYVYFYSEQSIGYLRMQLEAFYRYLEENDKSYNRRLDELARCIYDQEKLGSQIHSEQIQSLYDTLTQRQAEFDYIRHEVAQYQSQAKDLAQSYTQQLKYFFEKQTIYSEDFAELRKNMLEDSDKIKRLSSEIEQKFQNFEQNYFVSITARVLQCEGKIQKSENFSEGAASVQKESAQQIKQLYEAATARESEQNVMAETLNWLKSQIERVEGYARKNEAFLQDIERKTNVFRADLGDLIDYETGSRQTENADIIASVQQIAEKMSDIQDELLCKINFCNDFVVNSGLQREFNAARLQYYEDSLDGIFEEGCLEVGQVKLLKAITLRLRELESRVMQFIARSTEQEACY